MALTQTQVSQLYVSVFGRASEGAGNTYWQTDQADMVSTADTMLATDAAKTYFGTTLDDNQAFIEHIYENTLGKTITDDPDGIAYWVAELEAGKSKGEVVTALVTAAVDPANAGAAQDQFNNKVAVSDYTADTIEEYTDLDTFTGFISGVTDDATTLDAAKADVNDAAPAATYTIATDMTSVTEGDTVTFTVTASHANNTDMALNYQVSGVEVAGGTADPATDLGKVAGQVTIAAGETTGTFALTATSDAISEGFEGFSVSLLDTSFQTVATTGNLVVQDGAETGQTYSLTADQDTLTGTASNDTFIAGVAQDGAGTLTDTLQAVDIIDGGDGTDTLSVTLNSTSPTPTLKSVENVDIRVTAAANAIDFSGSTGVTSITVQNSTNDTGRIDNVGEATLAVKDQTKNVTFNGQTAASLDLTFDAAGKLGTGAIQTVVDLSGVGVGAVASQATTLNITTSNSNVEVKDTTGGSVATAATIAATGTNTVVLTDGASTLTALTVTGEGSVKVSDAQLTKLATLTVGDGGVTFDNGDSTATTFSATTGGGKDTLTVDGNNVKAIATGAGDDKVTTTTAGLAGTASVDLGAGDDTLTLHAQPAAAGATLTGGEGTDILATTYAAYNNISGYTAANLAKITGFETLSITTAALANADVVDLSKISGLTSAQILGVATGGAASITNVGADSTVVVKGNMAAANDDGTLTIALKDATGTADALNLTIDQAITQNNDGVVDTSISVITGITAAGIETLNFTSTGTLSAKVTTGSKTDVALNNLVLTDNELVTLNIDGDQAFNFSSAAGMTKLATINLADNTAGGTVDISASAAKSAAITVTGSAGADTIIGSGNVDTITGGAGKDTITGGDKADVLSGGEGNDTFVYNAATESTLVNKDVISDFQANTVGQGTNGAADENGATATIADRNGDVIDLSAAIPTDLELSVQSNAADAQTFIQNAATDATIANGVNVALDSSSSNLYIDIDNNGTVDSVIELAGVTTIDEAAFII